MHKVLIINRRINPTVWTPALHWCDSSGNRSVYFYNPTGSDYESAVDLPETAFEKIQWHVDNLSAADGIQYLCMRRDDPGLGIWLPEIDQPIADAGQLPDGCLPLTPYQQWHADRAHWPAWKRYKFSPPATDRAPRQKDGRPTWN